MRRALELTSGVRPLAAPLIWSILAWAALGAVLIAAVYQVPSRHVVAVGLNDSAYVQGFADPTNRWGVVDTAFGTSEPLRRSTGAAALIFPQLGLPAEATIRWRSASAAPAHVRVLQGGAELVGVDVGAEWSEQRVAIAGGLLKANDVVLELLVEPADGLLVQGASLGTTAWPIVPYPAQLAYAALAGGLGAVLLKRRSSRWLLLGGLALAFLLLYRLQLTPFPLLRLLPGAALLLTAVLLVRAAPRLVSVERLAVWATAALIGIWLGWTLLQLSSHVVLSLPGVERDFPVFASRAAALVCPAGVERAAAPCVLRADGFYQLGYPLALWAATLVSGNPFRSAGWLALASGVLLLLAAWVLAARLYRPPWALLAVAVLALSPIVVQYSISLGTDMPFAALWTAALAALLVPRRHTARTAALAGVLCGLAFMVRHPGIVLLPFGAVALLILGRQRDRETARQGDTAEVTRTSVWLDNMKPGTWNLSLIVYFVLAWLVAISPQLAVNIADTGNPLYSRQAKNIWLAVYADIDYSRWSEAGDDVRMADLVLADPGRFFGNWGRNVKGFVATGGEDTSEFGRAIGLRLLGFPANVLAFIGVGWWLWRGGARERLLVLAGTLYVVGVAVGFALPRFFLPVVPILALAAVAPLPWLASLLARRGGLVYPQWATLLALAMLVCLAAGPRIGARYVLERQDAAAAAITRAVQQRLAPGSGVRFVLGSGDMLDDASAIAGLAAVAPASILVLGGDEPLPPELAGREPFATAGGYRAFELR